ncbi:MAG: hypothetical protein ACFBZ8_00090 [Opitutales bacterium]
MTQPLFTLQAGNAKASSAFFLDPQMMQLAWRKGLLHPVKQGVRSVFNSGPEFVNDLPAAGCVFFGCVAKQKIARGTPLSIRSHA